MDYVCDEKSAYKSQYDIIPLSLKGDRPRGKDMSGMDMAVFHACVVVLIT